MNNMRKLSFIIFILFFISVGFLWLPGRGKVSGVVKDTSGAKVAGAVVTAENNEDPTITVTSTISDSNGTYIFENVENGTYTIEATKESFSNSVDVTVVKPEFWSFSCESTDIVAQDIILSKINYLIQDNFESYSNGTFSSGTGGWQIVITVPGNANIDNAVAANGTNKSLRLETDDYGDVTIMQNYGYISGSKMDLEAYIKATSTSTSDMDVEMTLYTLTGGIILYVSSGEWEIGYGESFENTINTHVTYNNDTWYKININIDTDTNIWKLWINNYEFCGSFTSNDLPQIFGAYLSSYSEDLLKAYIDEVNLSYTKLATSTASGFSPIKSTLGNDINPFKLNSKKNAKKK